MRPSQAVCHETYGAAAAMRTADSRVRLLPHGALRLADFVRRQAETAGFADRPDDEGSRVWSRWFAAARFRAFLGWKDRDRRANEYRRGPQLSMHTRRNTVMLRAALTMAAFAFSFTAAHAQTAAVPGPCEQPGAIGAIVDRPGLGRPTANNGSPCVVPPSRLLIEAGYRNQTTAGSGGTSTLEVLPLALVRLGLGARTEIILQPPAYSNRGGAALGGVFNPASGAQDVGFGFKRTLDDRPSFQDAVEAFYTAPTGTPKGTAGFSAGAPTYTLTYTAAFALGGNVGIAIAQNAIANAAPLDPAGATRFFSYQPSLTISYGFAPNFTLLVTDQITTPLGPNGGTGNRGLVALQRVLSPGVVLDAEYEINALPASPAVRQDAFGIGAAFEL
jgi:hypothetical protein